MVSAKFQEAYDSTRKIKSGPSNDQQLSLYAWAKIAQGESIEGAPKPGMFDMTGKAKRSAWQKNVDEGTTAEEAEKKYIELAEELVSKYGN